MERRSLLKFFPWFFSVFSLAGAKVMGDTIKNPSDKQKKNDASEKETLKILEEGESYTLPTNPTVGNAIIFINDHQNWEKNNAVVTSENFPINGSEDRSMLIDVNLSFGLRFLGPKKGWQYFQA